MAEELGKEYWDKRYEDKDTGWDIGHVSTPLKEYIDQLADKEQKILIPGAGNAYEAEYLHRQGFTNVFLLDISPAPLTQFLLRVPGFPVKHSVCANFFKYHDQFDLILEQTFFCALHPSQREEYAEHMHSLLKKGGKLAGVLFNDKLNTDKPPFGGSKEEYYKLFDKHFFIRHMEPCYNSIAPRAGRELFIELVKMDGTNGENEKLKGDESWTWDDTLNAADLLDLTD